MTLYQDCSCRHDLSKNMATRGRGIFSIYIYIENFKNLLVRNHWIEFNVTWQECVTWWPTKIFHALMIRQKTWPPGGGAFFPYLSVQKTLKFFLSETIWLISILLGRSVSLVTLYQDCSSNHDSSKNMALGVGLNLFDRNHWTDFNITWQNCSFGDPLSRFSSNHHDAWKQHGRWGAGL